MGSNMSSWAFSNSFVGRPKAKITKVAFSGTPVIYTIFYYYTLVKFLST
jgi:hypothetical protein